jgi:HIV Tat-specific factor 1
VGPPFIYKRSLFADQTSKVTWHSDDEEDDDPLGPAGGPPKPGQNRFNRVVVLKGMFAPADLDKDPALLLELKEDVRGECETMGQVTSCTLFDVSPLTTFL